MVIVVATSSSATNIVTVPTSTNQKNPQFTQTVRIINFGSNQNDLRRIPGVVEQFVIYNFSTDVQKAISSQTWCGGYCG